MKTDYKFLNLKGRRLTAPMIYTADFETTTNPDDCRVWAWAVCNIDTPDDIVHGIYIDEFMLFCERSKNSRFLFHNLNTPLIYN